MVKASTAVLVGIAAIVSIIVAAFALRPAAGALPPSDEFPKIFPGNFTVGTSELAISFEVVQSIPGLLKDFNVRAIGSLVSGSFRWNLNGVVSAGATLRMPLLPLGSFTITYIVFDSAGRAPTGDSIVLSGRLNQDNTMTINSFAVLLVSEV